MAHRDAKILLLVSLTLGPQVAVLAATWHVEQDGSGQFTSIFDAVEVAADGDTIRIGPGTYDDYRPVRPAGWGYDVYCLAWVWDDGRDLTFIGAGQDRTTLGNELTDPSDWHYAGLFTRSSRLVVEDLSIVKIYVAIYGGGGYGTDGLRVERCHIDRCTYGVFNWSYEPVELLDSTFDVLTSGIILFRPTQFLRVASCQFNGGANPGIDMQNSGVNFFVEDCVFDEMPGIVTWGANGTIRNCNFTRSTLPGVAVIADAGAQVEMANCHLETSRFALAIHNDARVLARQCVFLGGQQTIRFSDGGTAEIHDCHILNGGGASVYTYGYDCPDTTHINLTGNYWGTTDLDQINSWIIYDQNSGPNCSVVDFLPLADGPVSTERATWGGVKALFR